MLKCIQNHPGLFILGLTSAGSLFFLSYPSLAQIFEGASDSPISKVNTALTRALPNKIQSQKNSHVSGNGFDQFVADLGIVLKQSGVSERDVLNVADQLNGIKRHIVTSSQPTQRNQFNH